MNYSELRDALRATGGTVVIEPDRMTANIGALLDACYQGQSILISGAVPGPGDGEQETVVITGRSDFLNVQDLPVELRATVDADGNAQIHLIYSLLGAHPSEGDWKFSHSFPDMPKMIDWSKTYGDLMTLPLDEFPLTNASFVVVSQAQTEPTFHVPLEPGINFVANLVPTGVVSIIESVFGQPQPLVLYGTIILPKPSDAVPTLAALEFPWDRGRPAPGITLQAELGSELTISQMRLGRVAFRHYTPLTQEWLKQNRTYKPVLAYTGDLSIPSARIQAEAVIPYAIGGNALRLIGRFSGLSLAALSHLADLAGTDSLTAHLPHEIQRLGDGIGKLELTHAAIDMTFNKKNLLSVEMTSIVVGMPELNWRVWDDRFSIDSIQCQVTVLKPFDRPEFAIELTGDMEIEGVPVQVSATSREGFTVNACLAGKQTIPLREFISSHVPQLPAPSDLTIEKLCLSIAPFREYSFALAMADEPNPWIPDLGLFRPRVSDVALNLAYTSGGSGALSASFSGSVTLFDWATLTLRYDYPADIEVQGVIPSLTLSEIVNQMITQPVPMPAGFDLTLVDSFVRVQKVGVHYVFRMGTELKDVGSFVMEVRRTGTQWGFAAGISLATGITQLSSVLTPLKAFTDLFNLRQLILVISTFDDRDFTFPDQPVLGPALPTGARLTVPGKVGVNTGFNFFAQWVLNTGDPQQSLLKKILGLGMALDITFQVGLDPLKDAMLYLTYDAKLFGLDLSCMLGGHLSAGSVGLFLEGSVGVPIQGHMQFFDVRLDFVENGAFIAGTMQGCTSIDISYDGKSLVQVGNLALSIGCDWEGVPSLGVAGQFEALDVESSVAILVNTSEPWKSMVAGSMSNLSLRQVLHSLAGDIGPSEIDGLLDLIELKGTRSFTVPGSLATALDNLAMTEVATAFGEAGVEIPEALSEIFLVVAERGQSWFLTDLSHNMRHYQLKKQGDQITVSVEAQFYCVPMATTIGRLSFNPALYLSGAINVGGFVVGGMVDINPDAGIAVDAEMDKIVISSESFFSLKAARGDGGPRLSVSSYGQDDQPDPKLRDPHVYINGEMHLLGMSRSVYAYLSTSGIEFDIKGDVVPGLYLDAHGSFNGLTDFRFGGAVKIGLATIDLDALGTIHIAEGVRGKLEVSFDGSKAAAILAGTFLLAKESLDVRLDLMVTGADLNNLAHAVWAEVSRLLREALADAARWAELVYRGEIQGVKDVIWVLQHTFGLDAAEAQQISQEAWKRAQEGCALTEAVRYL